MKLKRRNKSLIRLGMISSINIIFLLLIFFITISTPSLSALQVKLPLTKGEPMPAERIYIAVSIEGKFFINQKETPKEEIETTLKSMLTSNPSPTFVIAADEDALHKDIVFLIDIANRNQYNFMIATNPQSLQKSKENSLIE